MENHAHSSDRCQICEIPLAGVMGGVSWVTGVRRSRSNPNVCNRCNTHIKEGNVVPLTVLFADLAGFTEMTQELGPERVSDVLEEFFSMSSDILVSHDGFIDKFIGDSVMAIFNVPILHDDHAKHAVAAALELQNRIPTLREKLGIDVKARVAIASGYARVGQLGSRQRRDYTAIGDAVNIAARLESHVKAGEILLHEPVYQAAAPDIPGICAESFELKGFKDPISAYRIVAEQGGALASCLTPYLQVDQNAGRQRAVGIGSTIFSLLGAPCAAGAALSPAALALGMGSALGSMQASFLAPLDQPLVRLPIQGIAMLGMAANLYTVWRGDRMRKQAAATATLTKGEKRRRWLVIALATITLAVLVGELYAHVVMGEMSLW